MHKMIATGFLILFGLSCLLLQCEGQVQPPSNGTRLIFFPGSTVKIDWSYVGDINNVLLRNWSFKSSDGSRTGKLAAIAYNLDPIKMNFSLIPKTRFEIEKPAALVLKNVNQTFNGMYTFELYTRPPKGKKYPSKVIVFIAKKPTVTVCSSPVILNEGDNFTCECQGLDGNPPANVTWYKDGKQIGKTWTEKQILTLIKVDETDSATYKCMAESYSNAMYRDEKSIRVDVKFKLKDTSIEFTQNPAIFGRSVTIMCKSRGFPEPLSYTIFHNDTQLINEKMYTTIVAWSDAGTYKCFGEDEHGNYSASGFLNVKGEATGSKGECDSCGTVVVWHIVVTLVSGIIIGILFSYIVWYSHRRWFRNRNPDRNPEPKTTERNPESKTTERNPESKLTEADTTYQELDLTKMNKEDNYQSLRVNAASHDVGNQAGNDDNSTYTELSKTRDMENKYQSLT